MELSEAINIFDRLLLEKRGKRLESSERSILMMAWENTPYKHLSGYEEQTVKNHATILWADLSRVLGIKINKRNIRGIIENLPLEQFGVCAGSQITSLPNSLGSGIRNRCFGRLVELFQLQSAVESPECKSSLLYGMKGIGKTTIAHKFVENVSSKFDRIVSISLSNAPPLLDVLAILVKEIGGGRKAKLSQDLTTAIAKTIDYLQQQRCLLVIDNADSIFGSIDLGMISLAQDYIQFIDAFNLANHNSFCLMIVVSELVQIQSSYSQIEIQGLDVQSCQRIVESSELIGTVAEWNNLIAKYRGNPLYLKMTANTIRDIFDRSIQKFIAGNTFIYDRIESFFAQQLDVLTNSELAVLIWLAIEREPIDLNRLIGRFQDRLTDRELMRIVDRLVSRYLIEVTNDGFALCEVMVIYITEKYQDLIVEEIHAKKLCHLHLYPILTNKIELQTEHSQQKFMLQPIVTKLLKKSLDCQPKEESLRHLLSLDQALVSFKDDLIDTLHELSKTLNSFEDRCTLISQNELRITSSYAVDNINNLLTVLKDEAGMLVYSTSSCYE